MIRAIIIDDEVKGSTLLHHKLKDFAEDLTVTHIFNDPVLALRELVALQPDVVFLDVEMPVMDGFQLLENIGQFEFEIIFVTAYQVYTLEALRANALDFLLKPVDPEELSCAVRKLKYKILNKRKLASSLTHRGTDHMKISLPTIEGIYFVKKSDIIKVEAMSNYSVFYQVNGTKIIVSKTLKEYEPLLEMDSFIRVNRSVIVNLDYVLRYKKGDGGTLELEDGSEIEVSSSKKSLVIERLIGH
ncbi:DNA-binding response regulator [Sphingobacterium puteale]|uniref:DNA-binding response regulator n=1 Tax=Sphingobacterium puteale TaxID=2420510 RepID=A0A420W0V4_9SPHI|nr:LytTR family DNA-binding domain-containing protein [Sphingobacterium puteale]RKO72205.1 DNA-binding response regulator [Sphingobacterium puteale]